MYNFVYMGTAEHKGKRRPVQYEMEVTQGVFRQENLQVVYRIDPSAIIYPGKKRELGFEVSGHSFTADRVGTGRRKMGEYKAREPISGRWLKQDSHTITLPRGTTFGAYSKTAHQQKIK